MAPLTRKVKTMELVALVVVIAFLAWALGFMRSARQVAMMANREVSKLDAKHKTKTIADFKAMSISEEDVSIAKANKALLESFDI